MNAKVEMADMHYSAAWCSGVWGIGPLVQAAPGGSLLEEVPPPDYAANAREMLAQLMRQKASTGPELSGRGLAEQEQSREDATGWSGSGEETGADSAAESLEEKNMDIGDYLRGRVNMVTVNSDASFLQLQDGGQLRAAARHRGRARRQRVRHRRAQGLQAA